ncbi:MAG: hypothetical protein ACRDD1_01800, partial [Planctomycetia bacterium]
MARGDAQGRPSADSVNVAAPAKEGRPVTEQQLEYSYISREIRSLVSRRRELVVFLGSAFAGLGILLQNVLERKLPDGLARLETSIFGLYSLMMLVVSVVVALRLARMHAGMIINGVSYSYVLKTVGRVNHDPRKSAGLNWAGMSTQFFLLTDLIASFAAGVFALAFGKQAALAVLAAGSTFIGLLLIFLWMHRRAAAFALGRLPNAVVPPVDEDDYREHMAESLQDGNRDLLATLAFAGLMLFSVFESMSGLGAAKAGDAEIASTTLQQYGP